MTNIRAFEHWHYCVRDVRVYPGWKRSNVLPSRLSGVSGAAKPRGRPITVYQTSVNRPDHAESQEKLLNCGRAAPTTTTLTLHGTAVTTKVQRTCLRVMHLSCNLLNVYTKCSFQIGWSDVTESMVTIRPPFCGYKTISCVELNGEHLSCYSNKSESVSLRNCLIWSPTYQQGVFECYRCVRDKHFSEFLPARWRQKSLSRYVYTVV